MVYAQRHTQYTPIEMKCENIKYNTKQCADRNRMAMFYKFYLLNERKKHRHKEQQQCYDENKSLTANKIQSCTIIVGDYMCYIMQFNAQDHMGTAFQSKQKH